MPSEGETFRVFRGASEKKQKTDTQIATGHLLRSSMTTVIAHVWIQITASGSEWFSVLYFSTSLWTTWYAPASLHVSATRLFFFFFCVSYISDSSVFGLPPCRWRSPFTHLPPCLPPGVSCVRGPRRIGHAWPDLFLLIGCRAKRIKLARDTVET